MQSVLIVLAGVASGASARLGGATPLASCDAPALARFAARARIGRVSPPVDDSLGHTHAAGSFAQLIGAGAGPGGLPITDARARAASAGLDVPEGAAVLCLDFVSIDPASGTLIHALTPGVSPAEARELLGALAGVLPPGVSAHLAPAGDAQHGAAGNVLIVRRDALEQSTGGRATDGAGDQKAGVRGLRRKLRELAARAAGNDETRAPTPATFQGELAEAFAPRGRGAEVLGEVIERSAEVFAEHPVNVARRDAGEPEVTAAWPSGAMVAEPAQSDGADARVRTALETVAGGPVAIVGRGDIARGVAHAYGLACIDPRDDAGIAATEALERHNLVIVRADDAEAAALSGDAAGVAAALARIDERIIAPIYDKLLRRDELQQARSEQGGRALQAGGDLFVKEGEAPATQSGQSDDSECADAGLWRLGIVCDRAIDADTGRPLEIDVPVGIAGSFIEPVVRRRFIEQDAELADLHVEPASGLVEFLVRSGMRGRVPSRCGKDAR